MRYGYIRISDFTPSKTEQLDALKDNQVDNIYLDSKRLTLNKSELEKIINHLESGDELYVYNMNCLSPITDEFEKIINRLEEKKINLYFMKENINSQKDNIINNFNAFLEYFKKSSAEEKSIFLKIRQENGEEIGRPKKEFDTELFEELYQKKKSGSLYKGKKVTVKLMTELLGISKQTVYDRIKEREVLDQNEE